MNRTGLAASRLPQIDHTENATVWLVPAAGFQLVGS